MRVPFGRGGHPRLRLGLGLLASTMLCSAGSALAQDTPPQGGANAQNAGAEDEEIIVTAQKRAENLQNVPISIQTLATERLEELNVADFEDYSRLTPSVSYQTFQPGQTNVYIRGVASG